MTLSPCFTLAGEVPADRRFTLAPATAPVDVESAEAMETDTLTANKASRRLWSVRPLYCRRRVMF